MKELEKLVIEWATEKGIIMPDNAGKQAIKLIEEVGELAGAILKQNPEAIKLELGDCFVVMIILNQQTVKSEIDYQTADMDDNPIRCVANAAYFAGKMAVDISCYEFTDINIDLSWVLENVISIANSYNYTPFECLQAAYDKIVKRTGKTVDGTFIADK